MRPLAAKTRRRRLAPFAGETVGGAFGPGLARMDSARIQGRFIMVHPISLLSFSLA